MFTNLLVLTWGWDIFEKEGTSEKGCFEIEDWGFSVHFAHFLAKILQNGAKYI